MKPFLKWAGGKSQLLTQIEAYYPFQDGSITRYAEPFIGGGAVLFDILNKFELEAVYISDINPDLINTYQVIRSDVTALIEQLTLMQIDFLPLDTPQRKVYYIEKRSRFNTLCQQGVFDVEKAALMIFLNKTCFNGLFRVNKRGLFNVPAGVYKKPLICDAENLLNVSKGLQNADIVCADYHKSCDFIDNHTFVYLDPPYRPLSPTASFTSYTKENFRDEEQKQLAEFANKMRQKGATLLISNSDPKNSNPEDNFFDSLYSDYRINRIDATRMISCKGESRGKIKELLISND